MSDYNIEQPIDLSIKKDLMNAKKKINIIKEYIEENIDSSNNLLALYGEWGSGKSSIFKTLIGEEQNNDLSLSKEKFKTILFDTWKYENDNNLAFSLFNKIEDELELGLWWYERKRIFNILKKSASSVSINLGVVSLNPSAFFDSSMKKSHYKQQLNFASDIGKLITEYQINNDKKVVIFIDDLDRCEPSNILDVLAKLKHFFTASSNIFFVVAIDKSAVENAIKIKYGETIDVNTYLDKIFSASFSIQGTFDLSTYFSDNKLYNDVFSEIFTHLHLDRNPRLIKTIARKLMFLYKINVLNDFIYVKDEQIEYKIFLFYIIIQTLSLENFQETTNIKTKNYNFNNYISILSKNANKPANSFYLNQSFSELSSRLFRDNRIKDQQLFDKTYFFYPHLIDEVELNGFANDTISYAYCDLNKFTNAFKHSVNAHFIHYITQDIPSITLEDITEKVNRIVSFIKDYS